MVQYVNDLAQFNELVAATANGGKPLIIDFTATWCPPCQRIGPIFEAKATSEPDVVFMKVDVDQARDVAQHCGIQAMPTFKLYKNGAEADMKRGGSEQHIVDLVAAAKA